MREMKDSGIEWIGIIPSDWKISRIKYVATFINGDRGANYPSGSDLVDEGIIFLTSNNIHGTMLDCCSEISKYITTDRYSILGGAKIALGDIIYCLRGSVGNCAINKEATEGTVASSLVDIRPTKIHPEYLNYILQSPINSVQTLAYMNGSCAANLSAENVANYYFIEPPVTKQRIISAFLDSKCSEIDSIISDIQSQIEALEEYKRSVITEAVTKGLDPDVEMRDSGIEWLGFIPSTWQTRKGKYIFVQRNERGNSIELQLLSPTQKNGVIPQDLYEEISGYKAVKLDEKTDYSLLKTIHKGDYCISLRSFQGGFEYSEYEGVVSPAYQVFYPVIEVFRGYYKHLFKTQIFIDKMNSFTMSLRDGKNIAFADFGNTYLPIPPIQEQQQITDYLDSKCAEIDSIIAEKKQQIETIEEYKKSLIFEYVTGKKEVIV